MRDLGQQPNTKFHMHGSLDNINLTWVALENGCVVCVKMCKDYGPKI